MLDPNSPISRNSPKAICRITAVRKGLVYFTYDDGSFNGSWFTALNNWMADYGKEQE